MNETKEVNYRVYCPMCKNYDLKETDEPCNECLAQGYNIDSVKPIRFEQKDYSKREGK